MADDYIKKALYESAKDLAELYKQDQDLLRQHVQVQRKKFVLLTKIHSLAAICDDIPANSDILQIVKKFPKESLNDAIQHILSGTGEWMSPAQIREYLIRFRIDLTRYKNPGSSIHTILGRLVESGKVRQKLNEKTKRQVFRWQDEFSDSDEEGMTVEELAAELIAPKPRKRRKRVERVKPKGLLSE
jgi:hypothetical protein